MPKTNIQSGHADTPTNSKIPGIFLDLKPNSHLLHLSVLRQLSNKRAGTASTKTRTEVRGGGKKPWKQKGTGRARVGSIRSPLWVGGGITFGPKPRSFEIGLPKKARNLAVAQAIAAKKSELIVLKGFTELKNIKTKEFLAWTKTMNLTEKPILIVASSSEKWFKEAIRASRNIPGVKVEDNKVIGAYDLLKAKTVAITEQALKELENKFSPLLNKTKG